MSSLKIPAVSIALVLGMVAAAPRASADPYDKKIIITFADPVEVPGGVTLQPGKYVFKLQDSENDRHIVLVQNDRENKTYAQVFAAADYRVVPKGKVQTLFWETAAGQPKALRAIFWPGDNVGQEFLYKHDRAGQLTQEQPNHEKVPTE
jgi:hypothetical protein